MNYVKNFLLVWLLIAVVFGAAYGLFVLSEAIGFAAVLGGAFFLWSALMAYIITRAQNG